jgi:hypothetical protein
MNDFRRIWDEGKQQRLESVINDMAIGIIAYANGIKLEVKEERDVSETGIVRACLCERPRAQRRTLEDFGSY